jgi:hypothetical protein
LSHSGTLPDEYESVALPIVNEQLERTGVRLAKVLNECLTPSAVMRAGLAERNQAH